MGVTGRVALTLVTLAASVAGGTAAAADRPDPAEETRITRAVVQASTPELPTGNDAAGRSRWRELRVRSRAILDRVAERNGLAVETAIPEIGQLSVDLGPGGLSALRRGLADDPRVELVRPDVPVELRLMPNDYAFNTPDVHAPNRDLAQWNLLREGGPGGWDLSKGAGAEVTVIDSGAYGGHPDLAPRIIGAAAYGTGAPLSDPVGHGTHAAGLACGQTNNGYGIASLGFSCDLFIAKLELPGPCSNLSLALVDAANRNSDVINMSIGGCGPDLVDALNYAHSRGSVLVAAGDNKPLPDGDCDPNVPPILDLDNCFWPEEWVQPLGTGPNLNFNRGLVVTSAKYDGTRSSFAESTTRVSVAAHGSASNAITEQQGILSTWPAGPVPDEGGRTSLNGDNRFAYLVGTSMATPQVAGLAALIRAAKPNMANTRVVQLIKATASHCGTHGSEIGWGVIRANEAVAAALGRDIDPPSSRVRTAKKVSGASGRGPVIRLRLKHTDERRARCAKDLPISGVEMLVLFASPNGGPYHRIGKTKKGVFTFHAKRHRRYRFYSIAVDKDGNREAPPPVADAKRKL